MEIDPTKYSGHSLRRGGATLAFTLGTDHSLIKFLGDWSSDVYLIYNEISMVDKLLLPRKLAAFCTTVRPSF